MGVIAEISSYLNELRYAGYYMTDELYLEALRLAGESQHL